MWDDVFSTHHFNFYNDFKVQMCVWHVPDVTCILFDAGNKKTQLRHTIYRQTIFQCLKLYGKSTEFTSNHVLLQFDLFSTEMKSYTLMRGKVLSRITCYCCPLRIIVMVGLLVTKWTNIQRYIDFLKLFFWHAITISYGI